MQPIVPDGKPVTAESVWYRGDEYGSVTLERDRYRAGLQAIAALFDKEDVEMLDFLEIAEGALK